MSSFFRSFVPAMAASGWIQDWCPKSSCPLGFKGKTSRPTHALCLDRGEILISQRHKETRLHGYSWSSKPLEGAPTMCALEGAERPARPLAQAWPFKKRQRMAMTSISAAKKAERLSSDPFRPKQWATPSRRQRVKSCQSLRSLEVFLPKGWVNWRVAFQV